MDDIHMIAGRVNTLTRNKVEIGEALAQHTRNFESYMQTNNHWIDELSAFVSTNHDAITYMQNQTYSMLNQTHTYANLNMAFIGWLREEQMLREHSMALTSDIRGLSRGVCPAPYLVGADTLCC